MVPRSVRYNLTASGIILSARFGAVGNAQRRGDHNKQSTCTRYSAASRDTWYVFMRFIIMFRGEVVDKRRSGSSVAAVHQLIGRSVKCSPVGCGYCPGLSWRVL